MGPVGHPSGNIFLRPLLSSILSFLHAFGCRELGSGIAYHESGHHHFWAGTFASTGGRYIKISSGESVFFSFLFLLFGIALEEVGGDGPCVSAILAERDDLIEEKKVVLWRNEKEYIPHRTLPMLSSVGWHSCFIPTKLMMMVKVWFRSRSP